MIDINNLFSELEELLTCNQCHGKMHLGESEAQRLSFKKCLCNVGNYLLHACQKVDIKNYACDNNKKAVFPFRSLRFGHAGQSTFCG